MLELPADGPGDGRTIDVVLRPMATVVGRIVADKPLPPQAALTITTRQAGAVDGLLAETGISNVPLEPDGRVPLRRPAARRVVQDPGQGLHPGGPRDQAAQRFRAIRARRQPQAQGRRGRRPRHLRRPDRQAGRGAGEEAGSEAARRADHRADRRPRRAAGGGSRGDGSRTSTRRRPATSRPGSMPSSRASPPWVAGRFIDWDRPIPETATRKATTGRDGRFRLEGIGAEQWVTLGLAGDASAGVRLEVATRAMEPIAAKGFPNNEGPGSRTIFGGRLHPRRRARPAGRGRRQGRQDRRPAGRCRGPELPLRRLGLRRHHDPPDQGRRARPVPPRRAAQGRGEPVDRRPRG